MALLKNLATALFERERIRTTLVKAKELRPYAEKLITLAKREDDRVHAKRLVAKDIRDRKVVTKLFDSLGTRFAARPGGYTRILRLGPRRGDGAEMAILELLGSEYQPGKKDDKTAKDAASCQGSRRAEGGEGLKGQEGQGRGRGDRQVGGKRPAPQGAGLEVSTLTVAVAVSSL